MDAFIFKRCFIILTSCVRQPFIKYFTYGKRTSSVLSYAFFYDRLGYFQACRILRG